MERTITTELALHVGQRVCVKGWLHAVRRMGGLTFLIVRDGWGTAQVVIEEVPEGDETLALHPESVIEVTGLVTRRPQSSTEIEIVAPSLRLITPVEETLPVGISKKEIRAALPTVLDHAVLTNRHPARRALFRLAATAMGAFRSALNHHSFTEVQTPKIVASATEGGANVFEINYFGRPAFLAQSPQFYKQVMVGVFERVYEVGPVFRAEPHDTTRHNNEYVSLDVEFGFIDNHFTVMRLLREVLAAILEQLAERHAAELELLAVQMPRVPGEIPFIHFRDAQNLIFKRHGVDVRGEPDLSPQDERWLGEWAREKHDSDFLFVVGYPMVKRPFYTHPDPAAPEWSNSFDLLFRGTELVTGGQRLHRYGDYLAALERAGYPVEPFTWYLEAFRYGMPPHGGFAIGLERLLMQLTGLTNVRLATLFPRDQTRLTP